MSGPTSRVPDSALTATSQYASNQPSDNHGPDRGRLFSNAEQLPNGVYNRGAWSADVNNQQQYIQVKQTSTIYIGKTNTSQPNIQA